MHVAMIIHGYAPRIGGAERQIGALTPALTALGLEVSVLTRRLPNTPAFEIIDGVPVYRLPAAGPKALASLSFTIAALLRLRKLRPDIIHAHEFISPATIALGAHYLFGIPFVLTPHLSGPQGDVKKMARKFLGNTRLALLRKACSGFIAISSEIDAELASIDIPASRRNLIGNGVDPRRFVPPGREFKPGLRRDLGIPVNAPVAVYAGRLVPIKQVDMLVSVWPRVRESCPDACLVVAGNGPLEDRLKEMASDGIQFLGGLEDVRPLLQAADVLVLPSDSEGLPLSILEAMSCGLPCVATRVGGIPEVISDGQNGILIPVRDPDRLVEAILKILLDPTIRESMGKRSRERILENYSLEKIAIQTSTLYQKVLQEKGIL
jgi:glycosyltransferase involved in cell wall biosynthesis